MKMIPCKKCKGHGVKFNKFMEAIPCKKCQGVGYFLKDLDIKNKKYVIAVDFDAVISSYKRPWKHDDIGEPIPEIINTMRHYHDKGYYILIFTGRHSTPKLTKWLKKYNIPYDGFNINPRPTPYASRFKPYYNVIIDDKAINFDWKNNRKTEKHLKEEIDRIIKLTQEEN